MKRDSVSLYNIETARYSRWFSKDSEFLVFFDSKGKALPITREEQDECLSQAEKLTLAYTHRSISSDWIPIATIAASGWILQKILGWLPLTVQHLVPTNSLPIFLFLIAILTFTIPEITYRHKIDLLRKRTAKKLWLRDPVAQQFRRINMFQIAQGAIGLMLLPFGYLVFSGRLSPAYIYALTAMIVITFCLKCASEKVDKTQVSQTGKWFRNK